MASAGSERPRLREYRVQLGWTQHVLADRLAHLAWMEHREHVAVNADMVAKWERGAKGVSPRYRELLCRLFGVTADQLGLKNTPVLGAAGEVSSGRDESLVGMVDRAAQLLDQLGAAGSALAPHMLHAWKDAATTRADRSRPDSQSQPRNARPRAARSRHTPRPRTGFFSALLERHAQLHARPPSPTMVRGDSAHTAALHVVTDAGGLTHLVTDDAMVAGRRHPVSATQARIAPRGGDVRAVDLLAELLGATALDRDSRGWHIGMCGHPVPIPANGAARGCTGPDHG